MYASRTGTRRNIEVLRAAGWRMLLVADTRRLNAHGLPYAIDNGAWSAYTQSRPWSARDFEYTVDKIGEDADWIALPDVVAGGLPSLELSLSWIDRVPGLKLIPVQDGMEPRHLEPHLGPDVGLFLGGTTDFKLDNLRRFGELARARKCHYHVARVNSRRRIRLCHEAGVHSTDGTSVSRFAVTLPKLDAEAKQEGFVW